ncbi:MAG: class I SAM-dependent methyltransferase [Planctomycetaceae bacterium]
MNPSSQTLSHLISPHSGEPLQLRGDELFVESTGETIPIRNGIPRFTSAEHLESFGLQWNRYEVAHDDEDRATFQAKTGLSLEDLAGKRVLDAGCGGGRYCKVAAEAGADVVGVDYTHAVDKAVKLCAHLPNVQFIQADLKRLPFPAESFDIAFSIGVMHHDVDTRNVFDSVARMVKPGGFFAVWLYRRNQWWQEWINDALRAQSVKMPPEKLERWCRWGAWLGGIPGVNRTLNKVVNFSAHPSYENRVCDTFDWYAPEYQHHHTVEELCEWFEQAGYTDLKILPPEKSGWLYNKAYDWNLLIGSGVNVMGRRA